jgi:Restriction endonuclease
VVPRKRVSLENIDILDETEFEELCFELLEELGFINIDWRKGTALPTSPADRGRDIVAQHERTDIDGTRHLETWFVDCKRYKKGVPAEKLQNLLAWATAERPHVPLFIASGFLSNAAKDFLTDYEQNNRPPFRIKYWERPALERLATGHEDLVRQFLFGVPRSESEILAAEKEFFDRVWYNRKLVMLENIERGIEKMPPADIEAGMRRNMRRCEEKYGGQENLVYDDFEWGMVNGKLSALRWVMGDEWDFLDT